MERALEILKDSVISDTRTKIEALRAERDKLTASKNPFFRKRRLSRAAEIGRRIQSHEKSLSAYQSPKFAQHLSKWEPWKLEPQSVRKGRNLHLRLFQGYASEHFQNEIARIAKDYRVKERSVWIGLVESIRKAQWMTYKELIEHEGYARTSLPYTIAHAGPAEGIGVLQNALKKARKTKDASALFDFQPARNAEVAAIMRGLNNAFQHGFVTLGASSSSIVGLDTMHVLSGIQQYLHSPGKVHPDTKDLLQTIAREAIFTAHPQRHYTALPAWLKINTNDRAREQLAAEDALVKRKEERVTRTLIARHEQVFEPLTRRLGIKPR
ncbi:MAG: hypothetical protein V1708_01675 [Candidatus Micrarchaeota archaeon]